MGSILALWQALAIQIKVKFDKSNYREIADSRGRKERETKQ
jgi:hypothetical protein